MTELGDNRAPSRPEGESTPTLSAPDVSRTALLTAAMRAHESGRPDRLFDDPLALRFTAAAESGGVVAVDPGMPPGTADFIALRTRYFDDRVLDACAAGVRQVVLLAAGLDARAFRLDWPSGVRLFELDLPQQFAFKEPLIAEAPAPIHAPSARCVRSIVAVDLRDAWVEDLTAAGFDADLPTVWVAEGLLPYLSHAECDLLLKTVTEHSAPGSRLVLDAYDGSAADRPVMRATTEAVRRTGGELVLEVDDPIAWLSGHGWNAQVSRLFGVAEGYGRPLAASTDTVTAGAVAFVAAVR